MSPIESPISSGAPCTTEWLAEANTLGEHKCGHAHEPTRYVWPVPLDVHVARGRRIKTLMATGVNLGETGLAFLSREAIPAFTQLRICRAGEREGVYGTVVEYRQTVGGYVINVAFENDAPAACETASS